MKKIVLIMLVVCSASIIAQPKGKMAPVLSKGYYVTMKGDTIRGEVQTNPEDPTDLYNAFSFRLGGAGKVAPISNKKAKAYGFDRRHFVLLSDPDKSIYLEILANGRLKFYEFKQHAKKDGEPVIESVYYIQDTRAEEADAELKEFKAISTKFYKRDLKPYMKDQTMIWSELDKFVFNKEAVVKAINEFNKFYIVSKEED